MATYGHALLVEPESVPLRRDPGEKNEYKLELGTGKEEEATEGNAFTTESTQRFISRGFSEVMPSCMECL